MDIFRKVTLPLFQSAISLPGQSQCRRQRGATSQARETVRSQSEEVVACWCSSCCLQLSQVPRKTRDTEQSCGFCYCLIICRNHMFLPPVPIMIQDLHVEGSGSLSHFVPNAAHSDDPKRCSGYFHTHPVNGKTLRLWRNRNLAAFH